MNLKGIKIDKKLYRKINEIGVENLKNSTLRGLDEFKCFTWSNFTKQEFSSLIKSLKFFDNNNLLDNISDSQIFIFNYFTDVTEMDIATVLKDVEGNNVIIDIEYKSGLDVKEKLDLQIVSRITDHMQQLFLNEKYIVIGMTDDGFYRASYYNGIENIDFTDFAEFKELFIKLESKDNVESILTQANNLAGIHKLYRQLEDGSFKYYEETKRTTEFILEKISEGKKAVICLSSPGTGKTVAAFKLFFENMDFMFLIMNEKFYRSLSLVKYFCSGRCFFGTDTFLSKDLSNKIVLIDEAQRLSKEQILTIINKSKATIIFGDTNQAFMPHDLNLDGSGLIKYLRDNGVYVHKKELKRSKRYDDNVEKALNYLVSKSSNEKMSIELYDYKINLFYNSELFLKEYNDCVGGKKIFTTFNKKDSDTLLIGDTTFYMAQRELCDFAIINGLENYIGHTLHAISFDVENNFVYLPDIRVKQRKSKDILVLEGMDISNEENITKILNELNILFTRGKKSLNILVPDIETYLHLNKKLKDIKS